MPPGASLTLRRKADGKIYIAAPSGVPLSSEDAEKALPPNHTINARQIGRELDHEFGSMFEVLVRIKTENVDALYQLVGFEEKDPDSDLDDDLNYNNWMLRRVRPKQEKKEASGASS